MNNKGSFVKGVINGRSIIYFLIAIITTFGVYSLFEISKDELPTFEIKDGLVVGVYPGATAQEVEEQLTKPLEEILFKFQEVSRQTYSYTQDGICYIYVRLQCPSREKNTVWSKIKLKLSSSRIFLPPGVLTVQVLDEFASVSSLLIAMESSDKGYAEMEKYTDELTTRLYEIPELANVKVYGTQKEEIAVKIDNDRLSSYGVNSTLMTFDYQTAAMQTISGKFKSDYVSAPIHIEGKLSTEAEIGDRIIWSDPSGHTLRLKDVATVERRYKAPTSFVEYNGRTALIVSVEMRSGNNIVSFGKSVDKVLASFQEELPDSVNLSIISNQPKIVDSSVWSFIRDLVISMIVVILVMLMLFPLKSALIASTSVPICIAGTIATMFLLGMNLNTVTLAALIVVLGMIVDDSVITMDGYMDNLGKGLKRVDAASQSMKELLMPMLLSTASISVMFYPMLGILSDYFADLVRMFPWVITIALGCSFLFAVCVVPSLEVLFIKPDNADEKKSKFAEIQGKFFGVLQEGYEKLQNVCFNNPFKTILVGVASVAIGAFLFTKINIQMMPMAVRDCFAVEVELEPNATLKHTKAVTDSLQKILLADKRVKSVTAFVGTGAPRFHATYGPKVPGEGMAQMIVNTINPKATDAIIKEYEKAYEFHFPEAQIRFKQLDYQAVTAPVMVTFRGGSSEEMEPLAMELKRYMMTEMENTLKWVHSDCDRSVATVSVDLDPEESSRLGVNRALLSLSIAKTLNGQTVASIWEGKKSIPINFYNSAIKPDMTYEELGNQLVSTPLPGVSVPLRQVADISPIWQPEGIAHTGGKNSITVYADMRSGCSQPNSVKTIKKYVDENIRPNLPEGVEIQYAGLTATNAKVVPEVMMVLVCAIIILFGFLLYHFKKILLSLLTIVLSLLCLFGATFGLWIFNLDFSITAVLGVVSLIGIVVRNGILMFEYAETLRFEFGYGVKEAAAEAGKRRMRPIFLTSCTTALGVLPMILSGDILWMPMGVVICFGTLLSIVLIVEIMPVCYWLIFRNEKKVKLIED